MVTLLVLIASNKVKAHWAAITALVVANLAAVGIFFAECVPLVLIGPE